jgi:hypothetical protein
VPGDSSKRIGRLPRGLGSRLAGDPVTGDSISTPIIWLAMVGAYFITSNLLALVVAGLVTVPAVASVAWNPRMEDAWLVADVFGFEVLRVEVLPTSRLDMVDDLAVGAGGRTVVPTIHECRTALSRLPRSQISDGHSTCVVLRAAMYLSRDEVLAWVRVIGEHSGCSWELPRRYASNKRGRFFK